MWKNNGEAKKAWFPSGIAMNVFGKTIVELKFWFCFWVLASIWNIFEKHWRSLGIKASFRRCNR
jgi:hypothetical protein